MKTYTTNKFAQLENFADSPIAKRTIVKKIYNIVNPITKGFFSDK